MTYNRILGNPKSTPQHHQAHSAQVPNNAGGWSFQVDKWKQLERFLILGTEAGTYYVQARELTAANLTVVGACLKEDPKRTIDLIASISREGRAIKNEPAILALAYAIAYSGDGRETVRTLAAKAVSDVCRTGTHILHFASYADKFRGWGRGLRRAVQSWYDNLCERSVDNLAYQMVKYQTRDGWSHKDLIRLAHPGSSDPSCAALYNWALHGVKAEMAYPSIVQAFEIAKAATPAHISSLVKTSGLSREMIPTDKLNTPEVAEALALNMPIGARIRNLGNMSKQGLLTPGSEVFLQTLEQLENIEVLRKGRVHPIQLLIALKTYASGHGVRGQKQWPVIPQIVDALDKAFYASFDTIKPLGKKLLIALDGSGSMGEEVVGTPGFSAIEAGAAMALVTAATEKLYTSLVFDTNVYMWNLSPRSRLDDVLRSIPGNHGGTDVSASIRYLIMKKQDVDAVIIYTDSETWHGGQHPFQAMDEYRRTVNAKTKLIVVATTATDLTVAAPTDGLSMTICGFDTSVPEAIRVFLAE